MTLVAATENWLSARARMTPDAAAVIDDETTTWHMLAERAGKLAAGLRSHRIGRGDRVALLCTANADFAALLHAVQSIGAVSVPLPLRAKAGELRALLDRVKPKVIATDAASEAVACSAASATPITTLARLGDSTSEGELETHCDPASPHSILFTSGTATTPKGVVLTNANHYAGAVAACRRLELSTSDVWIAAMPMNHVGGLSILLRSAIAGFAVVVRPTFDAEDFDRKVRRHGATIASLVPTMLSRWLDLIERKGSTATLRCALIGGASVSPQLLLRARNAHVPVATTYGLTETSSQVTTCTAETASASPSGVVHSGTALDDTVVEISCPDEHGVGEITVAGPQVMVGYFDAPNATAAAIRSGRLHTGDIGRLTSEGNLEVLGRSDEVIVTGGENVSPAEVEQTLLAHPQVTDAGVYATQDVEWGQAVTAKVVATPGAALDEATLQQWCSKHLAGHKVPKRIHFADSLPRTDSGKLRRTALAGLAESLDT
jgi:O-succinylbenzoic acid--CoA ligase